MRKICVVTGTRAEYGLLYWLMKEISRDKSLSLRIIATGAHLSFEFGHTIDEIEKDGFRVSEKVEMLLSGDSPEAVAKSMALGTIGIAGALARIKPDIAVLLGDRYEILAAAQAAMVSRVPIAHIHGGESTAGAMDEAIRHSVTKMSHLHFVAAEPYRRRVIQLGEDPSRVFNFGAPGLDNIRRLKLPKRSELEKAIGFRFGKTNFLVTYHPATLGRRGPGRAVRELLKALDGFPDARVIFTMPNADEGSSEITSVLKEYAASRPDRAAFYGSLGQARYLGALREADVVVGNSSSGIIEAPAFGVPTVNIGPRQDGRLRARSVIDCAEDATAIGKAVKKALSKGFRDSLTGMVPPYGDGNASVKIKNTLKKTRLDGILIKKFHDL